MSCENCAHAGEFPYCMDCTSIDGCPAKYEKTNDNEEKEENVEQ